MRVAHCMAWVVAGGLALADDGAAATFCVDTATELQQALTTAANNGQDDVIRVKTGTYATTSGVVAFAVSPLESFSLAIQGGYFDVGMFPCLTRSRDPRLTVISGSDARQGMRLSPISGSSGAILVEGLTFRDGLHTANGGGLSVGLGGYTGDVTWTASTSTATSAWPPVAGCRSASTAGSSRCATACSVATGPPTSPPPR